MSIWRKYFETCQNWKSQKYKFEDFENNLNLPNIIKPVLTFEAFAVQVLGKTLQVDVIILPGQLLHHSFRDAAQKYLVNWKKFSQLQKFSFADVDPVEMLETRF